jgi:hypothetical protein
VRRAPGDLRYDAGLTPSVFVCGDDNQAKATVELLVFDIGAHPVEAGPLSAARLVEPAMMLLVSIAYADLPRDVGLRLLNEPAEKRREGQCVQNQPSTDNRQSTRALSSTRISSRPNPRSWPSTTC